MESIGLKDALDTVMKPVITPNVKDVIAALSGIKGHEGLGIKLSGSLFKKEVQELGQLATKEEAAGKIRVFAMVDVWTQSALQPLHKFLFSFLKSLPNDGTHDQEASVKRCFKKSTIANCSFGYDLSAATDRLPIALQVSILESLFGTEYALA